MGRSTVGRSSDSLGYLETNFKKLTNGQEYEPVPCIMILQLFFSNSIFVYPIHNFLIGICDCRDLT